MIAHVFGLPRSGKTTLSARLVQKELRRIEKGVSKYDRVCTNYPISGACEMNFKEFGLFDFSRTLIIFDEASLDADNRDWKSFSKEQLSAVVLHGHFKADVWFFTQDPMGLDKKIRACTQDVYMVKKVGFLSVQIRIPRKIQITEDGEIFYGFVRPSIFGFLFGTWCYRPKWYKYFDSFWTPRLPRKAWRKW